MAKKYNGGIKLSTGFKLEDPQPIADYMVVELISDLDNLPNQFNGMTSFVEEDENYWIKKSTGWHIINENDSDTIARTIDVTLAQLGVATEAEVTFTNIVTYFNSLGLSKPATDMYIVRIVEATEVEYDLDIEGDFASVGITDYASWLDKTGVEMTDFSIVNGRITGNFSDETMTDLDLSGKGISKVSRINALNLTNLNLDSNQITEIKNLENLINLTVLFLAYNKITEIKNLENLVNLTNLNLDSNQITEVKNLENLVGLTNLNLSTNQITEVKGFDSLVNLMDLNLSGNQITEIKNLENLVNLTVLFLGSNQITEIKGLENLVNLTNLYLQSNQITEIKGLENLINLTTLVLNYNQITEIKGMDSLVNLTVLHLYSNQITEINGLGNLVNLRFLNLDNNLLKASSYISAMTWANGLTVSSAKRSFNFEGNQNLTSTGYLNLKAVLVSKNSKVTP